MASRGPPMRMASGRRESFTVPAGNFESKQLVAAHAGEVVNVAGFRHADGGINQQVGFNLFGGAEGQFHVGAMHRVAGLKGHQSPPSQTCELGTQFRRSKPQRAEVVVRRHLQTFQSPTHVPGIGLVHRIIGAGVSRAGAVEYGFGFRGAVGLPNVFYREHRQHHAFGIAQGDLAAAGFQGLGKGFGDVERDGHGPEHAAFQPHVVAYAFVVGPRHESMQG